ncbi:MAG: exodeoxyribonuclease VII small subunit [Verrucomicrobiota bacterium]
MARRKSSEEENSAQPGFEEALGSLETIIEAMEHEHLSLEDLVSHYEKGSALLNRCETILQSARGRIELITLRNQNEIALEADAKSVEDRELPTPTDPPEDPDDDDNDIRLF